MSLGPKAYRLIAQWIEHQIPILGGEGSSPSKPCLLTNC